MELKSILDVSFWSAIDTSVPLLEAFLEERAGTISISSAIRSSDATSVLPLFRILYSCYVCSHLLRQILEFQEIEDSSFHLPSEPIRLRGIKRASREIFWMRPYKSIRRDELRWFFQLTSLYKRYTISRIALTIVWIIARYRYLFCTDYGINQCIYKIIFKSKESHM